MPWKCGACFEVKEDILEKDNKGILWCANSTGSVIGNEYEFFGVAKVINST